MSSLPLLFVHVPKTAGTSFIHSLEKQFGPGALAYDYGLKSAKTSSIAQQHTYQNPDPEAFYQSVVDSGTRVLCGHFPVEKYVAQFGARNTMIILRDPMQRLVSEFLHSTRKNECPLEFPKYYRDEYYINRQWDFAGGIPLNDFGFIGITEHYQDSIALANRSFDMSLQVEKLGMLRPTVEFVYELDPAMEEEIRSLYAKDFQLYEEGLEIFRKRHATA